MNFQNLDFRKIREKKKVIITFGLIWIFLLHAPLVSAGEEAGTNEKITSQSGAVAGSVDTSRRRIFKRIPTLPFRDDEVHDVRLGYGMHIQLELPEKVKAAVPPDERLVSLDYLETRVYLKGIGYAVGEITNATVITESGKSLHLFIRIVEPEESDHGFKFIVPSKEVFSESHVKKEVERATEKREGELERRETNLKEVTDQLAEAKLKEKLLHEETGAKKVRVKEDSLEMKDVQVTRLGGRVYFKFTLANRSKEDFQVGSVMLGRDLTDRKDSDKVLSAQDLQTDTPTFESELILAGGETKVLLAFDEREVRNTKKVVLKVVEESGLGRVAEFKNLKLFTR